MATRKLGRPPMAPETLVISVRVTKAEHTKLLRAAKKIDRSLSRLCAKGALELADRALASPAPQGMTAWGY